MLHVYYPSYNLFYRDKKHIRVGQQLVYASLSKGGVGLVEVSTDARSNSWTWASSILAPSPPSPLPLSMMSTNKGFRRSTIPLNRHLVITLEIYNYGTKATRRL